MYLKLPVLYSTPVKYSLAHPWVPINAYNRLLTYLRTYQGARPWSVLGKFQRQ